MADQQNRMIARPHRSKVPGQLSPSGGKEPPFPSDGASSVAGTTAVVVASTEHEEDNGNSQDTMKTFTPLPPLSGLHDISELHAKDAATPVVAGTSPLPSPPVSPPDNPMPHSPRTDFTNAFSKITDQEVKEVGLDTPKCHGRLDRRANSQRYTEKNRRMKKNKGVVIGDFNGLYGDELSFKVGEEIEIISKDTVVSRNIGWWTGRDSKGKIGIFPAASVSCDIQGGEKGSNSGNSAYPLEIKNSEIDMKEVIGIGGFGKVYRALYKGEEVAVKVAKTTTYDSLKAVQDVIAEAEKFAHLAHINICALVGVVLVKDVCLVMECAQGGALSEVLHKGNNSFPIDVIIDWASQIASGMHYLHHEADPSLIHRDLKTSNILLAYSTDSVDMRNNVIKITDFGLAREIEHTTHMSGAGTYPWMAPEIIRTSNFSKKSDVWSFAVVLWEMVTGERPYNGLSFFVVAYGVGHGTLTLPIPDSCPELLSKLMTECWERDYTKRPSFVEIVEDIEAMQRSEFCHSTSEEEFRSLQTVWRTEIQKRFVELKKMELELERREDALKREKQEQERKKRELEEEKKEMRKKKEEYECLIRQLSQKLDAGSSAKDEEDEENAIDGLVARRSSASAAESPVSSIRTLPKTNTLPLVSRESPATNVYHQSSASPSSKQQLLQTPDQARQQPFVPGVPSPSPSYHQEQHHQRHQQHDKRHQQHDQHDQRQQQQHNQQHDQRHQQQHQQQQQQQPWQQDSYQPHQPFLYRQPTLQRGDRPPRLRPFSLKRLIRKLWGTDPTSKDQNLDNPLPDKMEAIRTIRRITSSSAPVVEKRTRSRSGGEECGNLPVRSSSLRKKEGPSMMKSGGKGLSVDQVVLLKSHKRRNSDTVQDILPHVDSEDILLRRGSVPNSPDHHRRNIQQRVMASYNVSHTPQLGSKKPMLDPAATDKKTRQRSLSDLRSPSPQYLLPSYYSAVKLSNVSMSPQAPHQQLPSLVPPSHTMMSRSSSQSTSPHPPPPSPSPSAAPPLKPSQLGLLNPKNVKKKAGMASQDCNSPGSPNVTVTPAEQNPLRQFPYQYDSGKDSMTCSDASGHSNSSEKPMIELDSPIHFPIASGSKARLSGCIDYIAAEFDPLRQSTSQDSLLDSTTQDRVLTTSPTLTPTFHHQHQQLQQRQQYLLQQQQQQQLVKSTEVLSDSSSILWGIGSTPLPMARGSSGGKQVSQPSSSISPKKVENVSPKQSLATSSSSIASTASVRSANDLTSSGSYQYPMTPNPGSSIARPRPRPSSNKEQNFQTISAPSSCPHSPKTENKQVWDFKNRVSLSSPTGSVKSMQDLPYDSDCGEFFLDSNSSSLINLDGEHDTMVLDDFFTSFLSQN